MIPPDLILHIGLPKTATTTLQTHVFPRQKDCKFIGKYDPGLISPSKLYHRLKQYVVFGRGDLGALQDALRRETRRSKRPLFISDENFTKGTFKPGSRLVLEKLNRLKEATEGMNALILVTLRPMAEAAFSARVQFDADFTKFRPEIDTAMRRGDLMGVYRYDEFRQVLEERWPQRVYPIDFMSIRQGTFSFPGFSWDFSNSLNTRSTPKVNGGAYATHYQKRPYLRLARLACHFSIPLARRLWNVSESTQVFVPEWSEHEIQQFTDVFHRSEMARKEWLAEAQTWVWQNGNLEPPSEDAAPMPQ